MTDQRVESIVIVINNTSMAHEPDENSTVIKWEKQDGLWRIDGPVYPRFLKMMHTLDEMVRHEKERDIEKK